MKRGLISLVSVLSLVIVCRIFCFDAHTKDRVSEEIEVWLAGKKVISITSDSSGGYGWGPRTTCIMIIAEEL